MIKTGRTYQPGEPILTVGEFEAVYRRWVLSQRAPFRQFISNPAPGFVYVGGPLQHVSWMANTSFGHVSSLINSGRIRRAVFTPECQWWARKDGGEIVFAARSPARSSYNRTVWNKENTKGPFRSFTSAMMLADPDIRSYERTEGEIA